MINTEIGLLYGGIQNSKDVPVCPYLINTMWQFGDSELGGWVYDPTLRVTCPTDPCSVLKCGFRAQCVYDSTKQAHCVCRPGYTGNPMERCYPKVKIYFFISSSCSNDRFIFLVRSSNSHAHV